MKLFSTYPPEAATVARIKRSLSIVVNTAPILEEQRQRAAADPPQPIEHRAKHQQDRQRAHRRCREWLGKNFCHALTDREERSGRDEKREAHSPQMPRQTRPA